MNSSVPTPSSGGPTLSSVRGLGTEAAPPRKSVPFSPVRVFLIAQNTLREAARQKLLLFFGLLAVALVLGARWFREFDFGAAELKFLADCGFGAMAFFGAVLVIAATAQLFFGELENRTVQTLLAKPVWRAEFIFGKFAGVAALAGIFCLLQTVLLAAVLWTREAELIRAFPDAFASGPTVHYANLVIAGTLQWLKLAVLGSLVLLVASFAQTQLFSVGAGFFILVIGHLQSLAHDAYAGGAWSIGRLAGIFLVSMFPNFQVFTLADSIAAADAPSWTSVARVVAYGFGYVVVSCGLAVFSFCRREI